MVCSSLTEKKYCEIKVKNTRNFLKKRLTFAFVFDIILVVRALLRGKIGPLAQLVRATGS